MGLFLFSAGCGGASASESERPTTPDEEVAAPATSATDAAPEPAASTPSPGAKCLETTAAEIPAPIAIPSDVTLSHILVKHRDATQADGIERSREEACLRAQEALDTMKKGETFEAVVASYSDSEGAESTGGLIGKVKKGDLGDDRLQEAAFALGVNQVSNVVESKFGFHIVLRTR